MTLINSFLTRHSFYNSYVVKLELSIPKKVKWRLSPGCYLGIYFRSGKIRYYSIANTPMDDKGIEVHICLKRGLNPLIQIINEINRYGCLKIDCPIEKSSYTSNQCPMIFISGGVGFAKIKPLLETRLLLHPHGTNWLIRYGHCIEDQYLHHNILHVFDKFENSHYNYINNKSRNHFFIADNIINLIKRKKLNLSNTIIYFCGNNAVINNLIPFFLNQGAVLEKILYDT